MKFSISCAYSLTTVELGLLVRLVATVIIIIADPGLGYAGAIVALELGCTAGYITCNQIVIFRVSLNQCQRRKTEL